MTTDLPNEPEKVRRLLLRKLSSRRESVRAEADAILERMGDQGVDLVVELVRQEAARRRKRKRLVRAGWAMYVTFAVFLLIVWLGRGLFTDSWDNFPKGFLRALTLGGLVGSLAYISRFQKQGTTWLARYSDPRAVGPLLDAYDTEDDELKAVAAPALAAALPKLDRETGSLLSEDQLLVLPKLLSEDELDLTTAALEALTRLEQTSAVPAVEALLARLGEEGDSAGSLVTTARASLTELQALASKERQKATLLRPADAREDTLVRPAVSVNETDETKLLRAASSG